MSSTASPSTPSVDGHQRKRSLKQTIVAPFLRRSRSGISLPLPSSPPRTSTPPPLPQKEIFEDDDDEPILHIVSRPKEMQAPSRPSPTSTSRPSTFLESPPATPKSGNTGGKPLNSSPSRPRTPSPSRQPLVPQTPSPSPPRRRRPSPLRASELKATSPSLSYTELFSSSSDGYISSDDEDDGHDFLAHPSQVASALLVFPLPPPRPPQGPSARSETLKSSHVLSCSLGEGLGLGPAFELLEGKLSSRLTRHEEERGKQESASNEQDGSSLMTPPLSPTLTRTYPTDIRLSSSSSGSSSSSPSTPTTSPFLGIDSPELIEVQEDEMENDFARRLRALEHRKRERTKSWAGPKLTSEQRLARRRSVDALFWRCSLNE